MQGPLLGDVAEVTVTRFAELDVFVLSALLRHGAGTGQSLHAGRGRETITVVPELDQQSWCQELAHSWQRGKDVVIEMLDE